MHFLCVVCVFLSHLCAALGIVQTTPNTYGIDDVNDDVDLEGDDEEEYEDVLKVSPRPKKRMTTRGCEHERTTKKSKVLTEDTK